MRVFLDVGAHVGETVEAVPGFERWFGVRPDVTPALRAHVVATLGDG